MAAGYKELSRLFQDDFNRLHKMEWNGKEFQKTKLLPLGISKKKNQVLFFYQQHNEVVL